MKNIIRFSTALICIFSASVYAGPGVISQFIKIDQFGYLPNSEKVAVISDPQTGYNASLSFAPGSVYEVRDWATDAIVYSGAITSWNSGAIHTQSGDIVYWFDFSALTIPGSYYIFDPTNNVGSYRFEINTCVYAEVMKHAMRMFYYQRCGFAKQSPFADPGYVDAACHNGVKQDTDCRLYNDTNLSTSKDLSGGWHDAGDYNKYVNFAWSAVIEMLLAYEQNPTVWLDNYNIPESGNGVPDLLDEVKVEMDWLLKMQNSDGSVLSIVGIMGYSSATSPPSIDTKYRVYGPATTAASISAAAMYALAAKQFKSVGQIAYATTLETAAINAWAWANANPNVQFFNAGVIQAGEQQISAQEFSDRKIGAAIYLYALTGTAAYKTYVENNYQAVHLIAWGKAYVYETFPQDALLYYSVLPGITPAVGSAIISAYTTSLGTSGHPENVISYINKTDAYRAFLNDMEYHWGSNVNKDVMASMLLVMNYYNLDPANAANYTNDAAGYLHYMHGVNPNSKTYLTNMGNYGAENSTTSIYHLWFTDGSPLWDEVGVSTYGPPPGYVPGGPNKDYNIDGCCPSGCGSYSSLCSTNVNPPKGQPPQKSWKDFNPDWPLNSFSVTEPQMFYQGTYIRMLSMFLNSSCTSACTFQVLPGLVQAEDYCSMAGIQTEPCTDIGGGSDVGYIDQNDYMDYSVNVTATGTYTIDYRVASQLTGGQFQVKSGSTVLNTITVPNTGAWQNWQTLTSTINLTAGPQTLRFLSTQIPSWNFNWFEVKSMTTGINKSNNLNSVAVYPNPIQANFTLQISKSAVLKNAVFKLYDLLGKEVKSIPVKSNETILHRDELQSGIYFYEVLNDNERIGNGKLILQ